jgi:O-antigen/teichoic acid export membrane protein
LEKIFYDGKYNAYSSLIPVWGIIPIFLACSSGFQAGIQAAKKTYLLLLAAVIWTLSSYFFGIIFVSRFGLVGLSWSAVIGYFLFVLFVLILYWLVIFLPIIREKNKRGLVQ